MIGNAITNEDANSTTSAGHSARIMITLHVGLQGIQKNKYQKVYLRQHSVLDWSPTSILSGPCNACLRGSDETRNVHCGMAADERNGMSCVYEPLPDPSPATIAALVVFLTAHGTSWRTSLSRRAALASPRTSFDLLQTPSAPTTRLTVQSDVRDIHAQVSEKRQHRAGARSSLLC